MIPDGYRIFLAYDSDREKFVARIPELGGLKAVGDTRGEALAGAEEQMEEAFRKAAEQGAEMPKPLDGTEFSGELALQVSPSLHRDLVLAATREGIEMNQLVSEVLSAGLTFRFMDLAKKPPREGRGRDGRDRGGRRGGRGSRYFDIMDDKASFMEYVRNLEGGGRGGGGRRGGRGRGRGRKS